MSETRANSCELVDSSAETVQIGDTIDNNKCKQMPLCNDTYADGLIQNCNEQNMRLSWADQHQHKLEDLCQTCFPEDENLERPTDVPEPPTDVTKKHLKMDSGDFVLSEYKKADDSGNPPCYLPQPDDRNGPMANKLEPMGPIGPWATGKVDWSPMAGLTGTRPVVDQYSITRFSTNEWRQKNKDVLQQAFDSFENSAKVANENKNTITRTFGLIDKSQKETTRVVRERAQLVARWKETLERAIKSMADEISTLEEQRSRLKASLTILKTPQLIASECLQLRATRPEKELVRDHPEEELIRELAMIAEIRMLLEKTLADITQQQVENRAARNRLEYDWSDKKDAYELELLNVSYNNLSTTTLFRPGVTRLQADQSSTEYWEHFTKETLDECERCRQKSINLRSTLDAILLNAARDLRNQADNIEKVFTSRIECMQDMVYRLENELKQCLQNLADTEKRLISLNSDMMGLDKVAKVTQSRLYNKGGRQHVENCRDHSMNGLINEVKVVQDSVSAIKYSMEQAEHAKLRLMTTRSDLEREIMLKKRCLNLDRQRCMKLRGLFPSTEALSGL